MIRVIIKRYICSAGVVACLLPVALLANQDPCRQGLQFVSAFDPWSPNPYLALGVDQTTKLETVEAQFKQAQRLFSNLLDETQSPEAERQFVEALKNLERAWEKLQERSKPSPTWQPDSDTPPSDAQVSDPLDIEVWAAKRREAEQHDAWYDDGTSALHSKLARFSDALSVKRYSKKVGGKNQHIIVVSELPENPNKPAQVGLTIAAGVELVERSPFSVAAYPISSGGGGKAYEAFALQNYLLAHGFDSFVGLRGDSSHVSVTQNFVPNSIVVGDLILRLAPIGLVMWGLGRIFIPDGIHDAEFGMPILWGLGNLAFVLFWTKVVFPTMHEPDYFPYRVTSEEHRRRGSVVDRSLRAFQRWRLIRKIDHHMRRDVLTEEQPLAVFVDQLQAKYLDRALKRKGFSFDGSFFQD